MATDKDLTGPLEEVAPDEYADVPDYYVDAARFGASTFTFFLDLGVKRANDTIEPLARVRMSPQHAKILALSLRKLIKRIEQDHQTEFTILPRVLVEMDTDPERDW